MLRAATGFVRDRIRRRGELVPLGFTWAFVIDGRCRPSSVGCVVATLQRPTADLPAALLAMAAGGLPIVVFFVSRYHAESA